MYVSSTANWPSKNTTNVFDIPNGTIVFARYYVGVWTANYATNSISTTFNGHSFLTNPSYYSTELGVTWIPYEVTDYLRPGAINIATIDSTSWGDGRQYGSTLVVVLKNETKPQIEYWIADGLDWMHYGDYLGFEVQNSNTYFNGTVDLSDVQNASLYSTHLTGFNYEDLNGNSLPNATESVSGDFFNYIRWDNVQGLLLPKNQTILVSRGSDTYCAAGFHALSIKYNDSDYKTPDIIPVNLTPFLVYDNTENTMIATIENRGSKNAHLFNVSLIANGKVVDIEPVDGLDAGDKTTVYFHWIPDGNTDSYSLTVVTDPDNVVFESNETNNALTILVNATSAASPIAEFSADRTSGNTPLTVNFTDHSTNSPTSWAWDFNNDGVIDSTEQNPTYVYSIPGTYIVNLTVTNAVGTNSTVKTSYINVSAITPVSAFTASPISGGTPLTVTFKDQSTNIPTAWAWDFNNDGIIDSEEQNPVHTYYTAGNYTVNLTVSNTDGSDSEVKTDYITVFLVANFTATPTSGVSPLKVNFTDQSTGFPTSWAWDFGDGSTSSEQNPTHTYSISSTYSSTYSVKLTVSNANSTNSTVKAGYIRISTEYGPVWAIKTIWNAPDVGLYATPCLADLDDDGDYDLLIGASDGISYGYENTGTRNNPVWTAKSGWNAPDIGNYAFPSLVDLDGDGDYDLFVGASNGNSYGYENTGTKNNPVWKRNTTWDAPNVGTYATPCLSDLDGDGDHDLFVGASNGNSYGYENTGTKNNPVWTRNTTWDAPNVGTYATPCLSDLDGDGDYDLMIGTKSGSINAYNNTGTTNSPVWTRKTVWDPPTVGTYTAPHLADLDSDGDCDLMIGNNIGISYAYENTGTVAGLKPDITPTAIILPSVIITSTPCTIGAIVNNTGTSNAGTFNATLSVNGTVVDTQVVSGIEAGSGTSVSFSWTPTAAGDYNLTVTADPNNVITESDETDNALTETVTASATSESPVSNFTADVTSGTAPLTVNFTDQSTGSPTLWLWDFGDGTNATSQNSLHTYYAPGTFNVGLTVTGTGGSNSTVKTNYINVNEVPISAPVADFTANVTSGTAPLPIQFTDTSTGNVTSWLWDFGDDSTATEQNVTHTYTTAGNYTVNLTVSNAAGSDSEVKTEYITVSEPSTPIEPAPVAEFTADVTSGTAPLTVNFTDQSTGTPSSWLWNFGDSATATEQNSSHTYTSSGTYTVNLTVANSAGNNTSEKVGYITVNKAVTDDLTIGSVTIVPGSAVFAKEPNSVKVTNVKNNGTSALTNVSVAVYASDVSDGTVPVNTTTIASLASGGTSTVTLIDPTIRSLEGINITYSAVVDPENLIPENNEANNRVSVEKPVKYNGYKGKRYWEGGSDITTKQTYDIQGNLLYSTQPSSSAYAGVNWTGRTETWTASDLPVPSGSSIEKVLLYVSYNWDITPGGVPSWTATFNSNSLTNGTLYTDKSNFGTYANHTYGLYVFDVTNQFNPAGNSLVMTPGTGNSNALYPSTLVVVYKNPAETRKQIFINEECDELAYNPTGYGTTLEEATAYAPFTGMDIDLSKVGNATLHSFAGSAGTNEGNLLFNGNTVATSAWQGDSGSSSAQVFNVKDYLNETGNVAGIQGSLSGGMDTLQQILVVEYLKEQVPAPVANFTENATSGMAPLTVKFDASTSQNADSYSWDFGDGSTGTGQVIEHTFASAGEFKVNLTVANDNGTSVEGPHVITVTSTQASLSLTKTADPTTFNAAGQTITYNYTVTNTGNVPVSGIAVTDDKTTVTLENSNALAPGSSVKGTATYVIKDADMTAGSVTNSANATGSYNGQTVSSPTVTATVTSNFVANAALSLTKTADPTTFNAAGQIITYNYTVTNTGNVPVSGIAVTDDKTTVTLENSDTLAPGSSVKGTGQYTIKDTDMDAGSVTNSANATGTYNGQIVSSPTATATVTSNFVPNAALSLTKTADPTTFNAAGQTITYNYTVTNTGNVPVSGIAVTDDKTTVTINSDTLAPGSSVKGTAQYIIKDTDMTAGSVTNSANATGTYNGQTVSSPTVTATVSSTFVANAALSLTKTADPTTFNAAGQTITYNYTVTNTGNVPVSGIAVTDDKTAVTISSDTLAPGSSVKGTATYTIKDTDMDAGSVTNSANATGTYNGQTVSSLTVTATVTSTFVANAALSLTKTADPTTYNAAGQTIIYNYTVTNTGNVPVSSIAVTDDKTTVTINSDTLAPGSSVKGTATYVIKDADMAAGSVTNSANATGTYNGQAVSSPSVTATVTSNFVANAALSLTKTADPTTFNAAGQTITYNYTVTNTGNVPVSGIVVTDDKTTVTLENSNALAPGSSVKGTATYTIKDTDMDAGSVTNSANATGTYNGQTVSSPTVTATVTSTFVANAALSLTKTADPTTFNAAGQTITYNYTVTNTGNVPVSGIAVTDDKTTVTINSDTLAPGSSVKGTAQYTIKDADMTAGSVTNSANATGTYNGQTVSSPTVTATVTSTFVANAALSLTKTADPTTFNAAGQTITYNYTVTNTGNVPVSGIAVTDDKTTVTINSDSLAPGSSVKGTAQYTIKDSDMTAGSVTNSANATGTYNGQTVSSNTVTATVTSTFVANAALSLTKTADPTTFNAAGQTITYNYTVTNTGNVPVSGITVTDDKTTVTLENSNALAPGSSVKGTAQYTIKDADMDAGSVTNSANATGTYNGQTVTSNTVTATVTSNFVANAALSLTKTADPTTFNAAGQTITYNYTVTNTGNVPVSSIAVTDDKTTVTINSDALAPGSSVKGTATYTIKDADMTAGSVTNSANATGTYNGQTVSSSTVTATVTSTFVPSATLSITKSANVTSYNAVGQVIQYTYTVANTGNVGISAPITVTDNKTGTITVLSSGALAAGANVSGTSTYIVNQDDLDNGLVTNSAYATAGSVQSNTVLTTVTAATVIVPDIPEPPGNIAAQDILYASASAGNYTNVSFPANNTSVMNLSFTANTDVGDIVVVVDLLYNQSSLTTGSPTGSVYQFLGIWVQDSSSANVEDITNATIGFRVLKSWIQSNNINQSSITLNRYSNGVWNPLPTVLVGDDGTYLYFTAQTPGFSPFAITGNPVSVAPVAGFSASPNSGNAPLTVQFTDASTGTISSYAWDFNNDGVVDSNDKSPLYTFNEAGTYTVNLTVTGPGGRDSEVKIGYISVGFSNKVTLGDTSHVSPSLASLDGRLYLAWKGNGNNKLNVMYSTDNGKTFGNKYTSTETSMDSPVLCVHNGKLYIAWEGVGNNKLNVAQVTISGNKITGFSNKVTLGDTSSARPSLASFNGRLYLAWKGNGNNNLNVMYSTDNGKTFGNKYTSPETSTDAPDLCVHNGSLYITWKGVGNSQLNVAQVTISGNKITGFSDKVTLNDTSSVGPVLSSLNGRLYIGWKGNGNNNLNVMYSTDNGKTFGNKYISPETSTDEPDLCVHNNRLYMTWIDVGNRQLNVAEISSAQTAPVADFSAEPTSGDAPLTVQFTDNSTGTVDSYAWDFNNDGVADSTEKSPSYTYSTAGIYTVNLTVAGPGGSDSEVKTNYITVNEPISAAVASFTENVTSGIMPLTVKFDASASQNADSYSWDFGDGNTGAGQVVEHTFANAGEFKVNLTVANKNSTSAAGPHVITVTSAQASLSLTKTANPTTYNAVGQKITYTYTVTNSGTVPIRSISVTDNKTSVTISSATLAPGSSVTGTGTYTIKQSDINAGSVSNSATATGIYSGKIVTSNNVTATVTSTYVPAASLKITKTADPTTYKAVGKKITYTYTVKNTGNVPVSGIKVTDDKVTVKISSSTLAAGNSVTGTGVYTITQADLNAGSVTNTATASGKYNGQSVTSNQATVTVTALQNLALTITKTASPTTYSAAGQKITYTYTVTNSGNVPVTGISVADNKATVTINSGTLAPGSSVKGKATYTITQADISARSVTNIASATGTFNGRTVTSKQVAATVKYKRR